LYLEKLGRGLRLTTSSEKNKKKTKTKTKKAKQSKAKTIYLAKLRYFKNCILDASEGLRCVMFYSQFITH